MPSFPNVCTEIDNDIKGKKEFEEQISRLMARKETLQKNIEERQKWNVREKKSLTYSSSLCVDATKYTSYCLVQIREREVEQKQQNYMYILSRDCTLFQLLWTWSRDRKSSGAKSDQSKTNTTTWPMKSEAYTMKSRIATGMASSSWSTLSSTTRRTSDGMTNSRQFHTNPNRVCERGRGRRLKRRKQRELTITLAGRTQHNSEQWRRCNSIFAFPE